METELNNNALSFFTVAVGLEYYSTGSDFLQAGDNVLILENNAVVKNGAIYGYLAKKKSYYDQLYDTLNILIRDGVYNLKTLDYLTLDGEDLKAFCYDDFAEKNEVKGQVIYADKSMAIIVVDSTSYNQNEGAVVNLELPEEQKTTYCLVSENSGGLAYADCSDSIFDNMDTLGISGNYYATMQELESINTEEEKTMENMFGKLGFGKYTGNRISLSMNGIAVRQDNGKYVIYNKESNEFVDVSDTLFNIKDGLFILPSLEIKTGDVVIHENKIYYIVDSRNHEYKAVSYEDCTQTILIPKTTMFGLKYFNKVSSIFGDNFALDGEIFKNPMMLMALLNREDSDSDITNLLMLSSIGKKDNTIMQNPLLLASLLKKDSKLDITTLAMLSGNNLFNQKASTKDDK